MNAREIVAKLPPISEDEWLESIRRTDAEWVRVSLPNGWREYVIPEGEPAYGCRLAEAGKLRVLFSCGLHCGRWWLHVSVSHREHIPTYAEFVGVKAIFVGRDRQALQIFPAQAEHVNIHPRCLHLWACLEPDGDELPRFGAYGTI